jgi:hypothetical protein
MEREQDLRDPNRKPDTPIIDGDARPDVELHPEDKTPQSIANGHPIPTPEDLENKKQKKDSKDKSDVDEHKSQFTKNRVDTNSLEDYKDAP